MCVCALNFLMISMLRAILFGGRPTKRLLMFSFSDLQRAQVQRMEKVSLIPDWPLSLLMLSFSYIYLNWSGTNVLLPLSDSDKDETSYIPPVKRERTSSFPPPHSGKGGD